MEYKDLVENFLLSEQHFKISNVSSKEECTPWSLANLEDGICPTAFNSKAEHQHVIVTKKDLWERELDHFLECVEYFSKKYCLLQEFRKKNQSQYLSNTSFDGYLSIPHDSQR